MLLMTSMAGKVSANYDEPYQAMILCKPRTTSREHNKNDLDSIKQDINRQTWMRSAPPMFSIVEMGNTMDTDKLFVAFTLGVVPQCYSPHRRASDKGASNRRAAGFHDKKGGECPAPEQEVTPATLLPLAILTFLPQCALVKPAALQAAAQQEFLVGPHVGTFGAFTAITPSTMITAAFGGIVLGALAMRLVGVRSACACSSSSDEDPTMLLEAQ